MKKVLVLGGNGYIGKALVEHLTAEGHFVTLVGRSPFSSVDCQHYISIDLSKKDAYKKLNASNIEVVIDLISFVEPNSKYMSPELIRAQLSEYDSLLRHLSHTDYYFFSSGGTVYGNSSLVLSEDAALKPSSSYGIQKCIQEEMVQRLVQKGTILRVTNPYGRNQKVKHGVGFVGHLLDCFKNRKPLTLTAPSSTVRDYIKLSDVVFCTYYLLNREHFSFDIFNVSTGVGKSLEDLISSLCPNYNLLVNTDLVNFDTTNHIYCNVLDNKKLQGILPEKIENKVLRYIYDSSGYMSK